MKKTLVAVAAFAAVSGAFADVTIGGNLNQAYTTTTVDGIKTTGLKAASGGSFVTFSGNEDLGSGLKAGFKFEQGLGLNNQGTNNLAAAATDASSAGNREAWINLSGAFGSLTMGNQYTNSFLTIAGVDPNGVNNIAGLGSVGTIAAVSHANTVTYALPSMVSGLNVNIQRSNAIDATTGLPTTGGGDNTSGYGINYTVGALTVAYADETTGANKSNVWGAIYNFGVAKIGASMVDNKGAGTKDQTYAISAPVGDALTLAYTAGTSTAADGTNNKNSQAGAYYALSKRTQAYVITGSAAATATKATAFGINHAF